MPTVPRLIVLDVHDCDIILNMDWLFAYNSKVDYYDKAMSLLLSDGITIQFFGLQKSFRHLLNSTIRVVSVIK